MDMVTVRDGQDSATIQDDGRTLTIRLNGHVVLWTQDYRMVGDSRLTRLVELRDWMVNLDRRSGSGAEPAYSMPRDLFYRCEDFAGNAEEWRFFDNGGETVDRYSIYMGSDSGQGQWLDCNEFPFHPQGVGMHGHGLDPDTLMECREDNPLGKEVGFDELPPDVQKAVLQDAGF